MKSHKHRAKGLHAPKPGKMGMMPKEKMPKVRGVSAKMPKMKMPKMAKTDYD